MKNKWTHVDILVPGYSWRSFEDSLVKFQEFGFIMSKGLGIRPQPQQTLALPLEQATFDGQRLVKFSLAMI
jgi:hypothetical protein